MIRKTAVLVLSTALSASVVVGCHHHEKPANTPATPPPAPPPPPPPAATTPPAATAAPAPAPAPAPEPAAAPKLPVLKGPPKTTQKGGVVTLPGAIVFESGKATIQIGSGSDEVLADLRQFLVDNAKKIALLRIEGHTDNTGTTEGNLELSGQRALTIKKWLIDNGIDAGRLVAVGFGQTKPIADNKTEEGRAKNRRTEFHVAEIFDKKGKPSKYLGGNILGGGKEFQ